MKNKTFASSFLSKKMQLRLTFLATTYSCSVLGVGISLSERKPRIAGCARLLSLEKKNVT